MTPKELMTTPSLPGKRKKARDNEVTTTKVTSGHRYHTLMTCDALMNDYAPHIVKKTIDAALGGDITAMKACMDKIMPNIKERPIQVTLPEIQSSKDAVNALRTVVQEVSTGSITLAEAKELANIVEMLRESLQQEQDVEQWKESVKILSTKFNSEETK